MKIISTVVLFLSLAVSLVKAQEQDTLKYWHESNKLKWSDFKGAVPLSEMQSNTMAVCPHEIVASPFRVNGVLNYKVSVLFFKNEAWTKDTSSCTLAHEQLHFDIAELCARRLRKSIQDIHKIRGVNFGTVIENGLSEERKMQHDFDEETANGIYAKKQLEWQKKVARELALLKAYSEP